jgi:hypothetical protein
MAQRAAPSDLFRKYVKRLPDVDRIEVAELKPVLTDNLKEVDCKQAGLVCAPDMFPYRTGSIRTLRGHEAIAVATMWRSQARDYLSPNHGCLTPDYLLRFFKADKLILQTQACALCHEITLPVLGVVRVGGPFRGPYYDLQNWLLPDPALAKRWQSFTEKMIPKVGQEVTVIGLIELGKGVFIFYDDWEIGLERADLGQINELLNLGCHTAVKVTGVLKHYTLPANSNRPIAVQRPPDHFYFDRPRIEVMRVEKPRHRKRSHKNL